MNKRYKNARFWNWVNGAYVKLTLEPGQVLNWHNCEGHEEGWSSYEESWELSSDGEVIVREYMSDGTDCDGRLSSGGTMIASADGSTFRDYAGEGYFCPDWVDDDRWQRDQSAEAAGY